MTASFKLLVGPALGMIAIATMYALSINPNEGFNRADAAFTLMFILSGIHVYMAYQWYMKGYLTYELMKKSEELAAKVIEKLITDYVPGGDVKATIEKVSMDAIDGVVKDLTDIIDKHKS